MSESLECLCIQENHAGINYAPVCGGDGLAVWAKGDAQTRASGTVCSLTSRRRAVRSQRRRCRWVIVISDRDGFVVRAEGHVRDGACVTVSGPNGKACAATSTTRHLRTEPRKSHGDGRAPGAERDAGNEGFVHGGPHNSEACGRGGVPQHHASADLSGYDPVHVGSRSTVISRGDGLAVWAETHARDGYVFHRQHGFIGKRLSVAVSQRIMPPAERRSKPAAMVLPSGLKVTLLTALLHGER